MNNKGVSAKKDQERKCSLFFSLVNTKSTEITCSFLLQLNPERVWFGVKYTVCYVTLYLCTSDFLPFIIKEQTGKYVELCLQGSGLILSLIYCLCGVLQCFPYNHSLVFSHI